MNGRAKTRSQRILHGLPATAAELAAIEGISTYLMNAALCDLRRQGLVRLSDRKGERASSMGRAPRIWVRVR